MNLVKYLGYMTVIISDRALGWPVEEDKSRGRAKPWENPCMAAGHGDPAAGSASGDFGFFDNVFADSKPLSLDDDIEEMSIRCAEAGEMANDLREDIVKKRIQSQTVVQSLNGTHLPGFSPLVMKHPGSSDEIKQIFLLHLVHIQTATIFLDQLLTEEEDGELKDKITKLSEHLSGILCLLEEILSSQAFTYDDVNTDVIRRQISGNMSRANRAARAYVFMRDLGETLKEKKTTYSEIKSKRSEQSDGV